MLDFSNEDAQKEFSNGPVPENSVVMVTMEVLEPNNPAPDNPYIRVAGSGLRQIYCKFTVAQGTYAGYSFRQNINLPVSAQTINLTQGQEKACRIGGAQLKAICQAANKPTKAQDVTSFTGLGFPVKVRINQRKNGNYWNNEIGSIITPDKAEYARVRQEGEIITDGPVTGREDNSYGYGGGYNDNGINNEPMPNNDGGDSVPF